MANIRHSFRSIPLPAIAMSWVAVVLAWFELRAWPDLAASAGEFAVPFRSAGLKGMAWVWAGRSGGLAVFLVLQAASLGAGTLLAGLLRRRLRFLLVLPLGWLVLGLLFAAVGLAGLAFPILLAVLTIAPIYAVRWRDFRPVKNRRKAGSARGGSASGLFIFSAAVALLGLFIILLCGLAPEIEGDPLTCHYANPIRILGLHRMTAVPFSIHDDYPFLYESLLLPLFATAGEYAVRWFNPFLLAFISLAVFRSGARFMGRGWAAFAAALVVTSPFLASQAVVAKNDLLVAAFGFAAIEAVAISRSARGMLSAGLLCGGAFAVKYNGAYLVPAVAVAGLAGGGLPVGRLVLLLPGAVLGALPVLAKNFLLTGDPLYPFLGALFSGPFSSPISRVRLREHLYVVTLQDPSAIGPELVIKSLFGAGAHPDESLGRWFLLLPAVALVRRLSPEARVHLAALAVLLVAWAAGPPHARYAAALFPSGCLMAAYGISSFALRVSSPAAAALAGVLLTVQAVHSTVSVPNALRIRAGLGIEDAGSYRARRLGPGWDAVQAVGREVPAAGRMLMHGENRSALFGVRSDFAAFGGPAFPPFEALRESRTPDEVWKKFRQRGWTALLYKGPTAYFWRRSLGDDPWTDRELALWGQFWRGHAVLVWESPYMDAGLGYYHLFRLTPKGGKPSWSVLPGIEGWVFKIEQEASAGNRREMMSRFNSLRRTAGSYGVVDMLESVLFRGELSRAQREKLVLQAGERGYRSLVFYLTRAYIAAKAGDRPAMNRWLEQAREFQPGLTGEYFDQVRREMEGAGKPAEGSRRR